MACDENIVRLTYKQLKEMAEGNHREAAADGVFGLTALLSLPP